MEWFLIPTPPLVIKLRIFRNGFIFFSYFLVGPTTILIPVYVSKHRRTQEWKSIPLFPYPFQVSKHAIILYSLMVVELWLTTYVLQFFNMGNLFTPCILLHVKYIGNVWSMILNLLFLRSHKIMICIVVLSNLSIDCIQKYDFKNQLCIEKKNWAIQPLHVMFARQNDYAKKNLSILSTFRPQSMWSTTMT
jgi:hypothetical protein